MSEEELAKADKLRKVLIAFIVTLVLIILIPVLSTFLPEKLGL